jgi:hypothetical protein
LSVTGDAPSAPAEAPISGPPDLLAPAPNIMQGGIGYVFPERTFSSALGSKVRAEFGASETQASVALTPGRQNPLIGNGSNGMIVGGCAGCNFPLTSDYSRRQTNFKAASDFNVHGVTVSPSVTLYGASNQQNFAPAVANRTSSTMQWNDVGAKVGLDTKLDIAPKVTVGLGGNLGVARRDTTLVPNTSAPGSSSSGEASAVTAPLLGNAEAKVVYKPLTELELKTYGGVQGYDSRVPSMALTPGGSAAGIKFTPEHGYYAGAGLTYRFGSQ